MESWKRVGEVYWGEEEEEGEEEGEGEREVGVAV